MNLADQTLLEVDFYNKLNFSIDQFIRNDFIESDVENFIQTVKTFLTHPEIKDYVKTALYNKANEISKIFVVIDKGLHYSYKKLIAILISLDETELTEMLETNFAKEKKLDNFFLLIEEKVNQNKSVSNCENLFLSLMTLHNFQLEYVERFINAIRKDREYIVSKLIENKSHSTLRKYLEELAAENPGSLKSLIPIIIEKYDDHILHTHYLDLVKTIITYSNDFTDKLLINHDWNLRYIFEKYLLTLSIFPPNLIKNYSHYLISKKEAWFNDFEKSFLEIAKSEDIVDFANNVPHSNKRLILQRLVDLKEIDEDSLVVFIRNFPEYENLLPLL